MAASNDGDILAAAQLSGTQLSLAGQDLEEIPAILGETYGDTVTHLDFSYNCLRGVGNLALFTKLESLVLDNNEIVREGIDWPKMKKLQTLCMNNNQIEDIEGLLADVARKFPNLRYISLLKNPCCPTPIFHAEKDEDDYQRYRYFVLHKLPKLQFIDSNEVTEEEMREAKRVGKFMRVARPAASPAAAAETGAADGATDTAPTRPHTLGMGLSPLPDSTRAPGRGAARFGVTRYVYKGTASEGNRFITEEDL